LYSSTHRVAWEGYFPLPSMPHCGRNRAVMLPTALPARAN